MNRLVDWIQAAGIPGVLIGIVMVLIQLHQNEELLRVQIAADPRINRDSDRNVTRGKDFPTKLVRTQIAPEELTDAELVGSGAHASSLFHELPRR